MTDTTNDTTTEQTSPNEIVMPEVESGSFLSDVYFALLEFFYDTAFFLIHWGYKFVVFLLDMIPDFSFVTGWFGEIFNFLPADIKPNLFFFFDRLGFSTAISIVLFLATIKLLIKLIPWVRNAIAN